MSLNSYVFFLQYLCLSEFLWAGRFSCQKHILFYHIQLSVIFRYLIIRWIHFSFSIFKWDECRMDLVRYYLIVIGMYNSRCSATVLKITKFFLMIIENTVLKPFIAQFFPFLFHHCLLSKIGLQTLIMHFN